MKGRYLVYTRIYLLIFFLSVTEEVLKERKEEQNIPSEECAPPVHALLEDETVPLLEPLVPEDSELKVKTDFSRNNCY